MFSGKNKKNSIISLALIAIVASALFLLSGVGITARAETAEYYIYKYVVNGVSSYEYDQTTMANVEAKAEAYHGVVEAQDDTVEKSFERMNAYFALETAVEEYNANHSTETGYTLSVLDKEYEPIDTYAKANASLKTLASGWEDAHGSEYIVKYQIAYSGTPILQVYAIGTNGSYVAEGVDGTDGVSVKANGKGKNEVQDLNFVYNGKECSVEVILSKQEQVGDNTTGFVTTVVYGFSKIEAKEDGQASSEFTVEGFTQEEKIGVILNTANKDFSEVIKTELKTYQDYETYKTIIENKIATIRTSARATLLSRFDETLYKVSDYEAIEQTVDGLINGNYEGFKNYVEGTEKITEKVTVKDYPTQFKEKYAGVTVPNVVYEDNKQEALDALEELIAINGTDFANYVSPETLSELFEQTKQTIFDNLKRTAKEEIKEQISTIDLSDYSPAQRMEITKRYYQAVNELDGYTDYNDYEDVENFTTSFSISNLVAGTQTKLEKDGVTVEIIGAKFADGSSIEFVGGEQIVEQPEAVVGGKKTNVEIRKLNALNAFDIKVKDGYSNQFVEYAIDGVQYTVVVKLSEETLQASQDTLSYIASEEGSDSNIKEILILHVDKDGKTEVIKGKFNKSEGTIMFTTTHFSTFYLMGNTSNLAFQKVANLLSAFAGMEDILMYVLIGLGAIVGVVLLFTLIAFIVSVCTKYKIKFVSNGGTKVKKLRRRYGKKLPEFVKPTREGYVFDGWCIDKTLKYEFNRNVMPRSNITLYARWISEEEVQAQEVNEKQLLLVGYYDKLRAKLSACKKPVKQGEKSFVAQELLAKLYAEEEQVKLLVKTKLANLIEENGVVAIVADADKYEEFAVNSEETFNAAVEAINKMATVNGLVVTEEQAVSESTYEEAVAGYAYIINYEEVANQAERFTALRAYALTFELSDKEKVTAGKVVFEIIPEETLLNLTLSLDMAKYAKVLEEKTVGGELNNVYVIASGENMGVAFELVERVLNENGFVVGTASEEADGEFNATEAYQYIIAGEEPVEEVVEEVVEEETAGDSYAVEVPVEEPVEEVVEEEPVPEIPLGELFKQFRAYVCSFAMFAGEDEVVDRTNDGRVIVRAKLGAEAVETTIDPECDAEAFIFNTAKEFEVAKEKVDAVMAKYGFEFSEPAQVSDVELSEGEMFGYRIKFPPEMTAEQMLGAIRNYANSFAMFVSEGVEPDTSLDGKVVVKAILADGAVAVTVDPEADAEQFTVAKEADLTVAKEKINAVMTKYGLEVDPDYAPASELAGGDSFGFRIKF